MPNNRVAGLALPEGAAQQQAQQIAVQKAVNGIFLNLLYSLVSGRPDDTVADLGRRQLLEDAAALTVLAAGRVGIQIQIQDPPGV